jgi:hypothetical protein
VLKSLVRNRLGRSTRTGFSPAATLLRILISVDIQVYCMQRLSPSLEEIFLGLTEHSEGVAR